VTGTTATADPAPYHGRFAPSPTGPLHFGSLVAALGSCLDARSQGGLWSVRIENLDTQREVPGAADLILRTLEGFGFEWDGPVVVQSERLEAYADALNRLEALKLTYPCSCSRSEIESRLPAASTEELRYPGSCRGGPLHPERPLATRFRTPSGGVAFIDGLQGKRSFDVSADVGDFVLRRRDGYYAYHLAVVVDDSVTGINHVVRGADLLSSTPRQILLQRALGLASPQYAHLPLAVDPTGCKLSKSAQSLPIVARDAQQLLWQALAFLGQDPPADLRQSRLIEIWDWAVRQWSLAPITGIESRPAPCPRAPDPVPDWS